MPCYRRFVIVLTASTMLTTVAVTTARSDASVPAFSHVGVILPPLASHLGPVVQGVLSLIWVDSTPAPLTEFAPQCGPAVLVTDALGRQTEIDVSQTSLTIADLLDLNGKRVVVSGEVGSALGSPFQASRIDADSISNSTSLPRPSATLGDKPFIVIPVRFSDSTGTTPFPVSYYQGMVSAVYPGVADYWGQQSYQKVNFGGSTVLNWVNL